MISVKSQQRQKILGQGKTWVFSAGLFDHIKMQWMEEHDNEKNSGNIRGGTP